MQDAQTIPNGLGYMVFVATLFSSRTYDASYSKLHIESSYVHLTSFELDNTASHRGPVDLNRNIYLISYLC